jgi:hypothetical protein
MEAHDAIPWPRVHVLMPRTQIKVERLAHLRPITTAVRVVLANRFTRHGRPADVATSLQAILDQLAPTLQSHQNAPSTPRPSLGST